MHSRHNLHPERVLLYLLFGLLITAGILGALDLFTGDHRYYLWAAGTFAAAFLVASTPLLIFFVGLVIERYRGERKDSDDPHGT